MKRGTWSRRWRAFLLSHAPRTFARWCTLDDRELGEWGEEIAARYLRARGARILARRFDTAFVEVDIVALERGAIVCVEVKTGRLEPLPRPRGEPGATAPGELRWRPGHRCDASRVARLRRAARSLERDRESLRRNGNLQARPPGRTAHVDLIEVILPRTTRRPRIVHRVDIRRPWP
jgi:hypothetical protein